MFFRHGGNYERDYIFANDKSLWMTFPSDIMLSILPYSQLTYHIECATKGLKCLILATNYTDSMTLPSIVLLSWRVYGEDINWTILYHGECISSSSMVPI